MNGRDSLAGRSTEAFKVIGRRLAKIRAEHGLTQRALAERLDKPASFIGKVELAERRLDVLDVMALAAALDIPPEDLFLRVVGLTDNSAD